MLTSWGPSPLTVTGTLPVMPVTVTVSEVISVLLATPVRSVRLNGLGVVSWASVVT